jgi:hypothetical protein
MKSSNRWILLLAAFILMFSCTSGKPFQQGNTSDSLYFAETGVTVSGPFLAMYQSVPDPLNVFGFPLTDVLDHSIEPNVKVQYFYRAQMEYDSSKPEGSQITLADLGSYFYDESKNGVDANLYTNNAACRFFTETQIPVCYLFLEYYNAHNGGQIFGLPISNVRNIDGRVVQYFEKVRMEWRPEQPPGQRVRLTDLGKLNWIIQGSPTAKKDNTVILKLTQAYVRIFPAQPLVGPNQSQTLFIIVQNQVMQPYPGAQVFVTIVYPDGRSVSQNRLLSTDADGIAKMENISTAGVKPGQFVKVEVQVTTSPNEAAISATSWFRVWW